MRDQSWSENFMQIQKGEGTTLDLVVRGNWKVARASAGKFIGHLGDAGTPVASDLSVNDGQAPDFSDGTYVDIISLDRINFAAVTAMLNGIESDLGLIGVRADYSRARIYEGVAGALNLNTSEEYVQIFGLTAEEVRDFIARTDQAHWERFGGAVFVTDGERPKSGFEVYTTAKIAALKASTADAFRSNAGQVGNDGRVTILKTVEGPAYVTIDFPCDGNDYQSRAASGQQAMRLREAALNKLEITNGRPQKYPALPNLDNPLTFKVDKRSKAKILAELLKTQGITKPTLLKIEQTFPPSFPSRAADAIGRFVVKLVHLNFHDLNAS